jgi:actin-related protein
LIRERGYSLQRKYAAWIGGSLLGSFDTYHRNLKITRQEWEENPDVVLNTRSF